MHIALLGTRGVPARYGGFETAVEEIGRRLVKKGHRITVYCRGDSSPNEYLGMRRVCLPYLPRQSLETLSHSLLSAMHLAIQRADACVVFNAANVPVVPVIKARGIPVAVHVDGLEWQRGKWGRFGQNYYKWAEEHAVRWGDALIADAIGIQDYYIEKFGAKSVFIPYGAPRIDEPRTEKLERMGLAPGGYHLVVARMEPENHLDLILDGYRESRASLPLVVVGSVPRPSKYQQLITEIAAKDSRVRLVGSVWDQELLDTLYAASASYIHGHSVGGTNPSLLRAMGAGARTVAIDVVFNREVLGETGAFFKNRSELAEAIETTEHDLDLAVETGRKSRDRAMHLYDWDVVAEQYLELCNDLALRSSVRDRKEGGSSLSGTGSMPTNVPASGSLTQLSDDTRINIDGSVLSVEKGTAGDKRECESVLVLHPSDENYGADSVLRETIRFIMEDRRVDVWLPNDLHYPKRLLSKQLAAWGVDVCRVSLPVLRRSNLGAMGILNVIRRMAILTRAIRKHDCAAVYLNTSAVLPAALCARVSGRKVLFHQHEIWSATDRAILKWFLLFVDRVIGPSEAVLDSLPQRFKQRARVIPNSTDERTTTAEPIDRALRSGNNRLRFLMASRWHPGKGYAEFLSAWEKADLSDAELIILGGPPLSGPACPVNEIVSGLRNRDSVAVVGEVDSITEYVKSADVMVVPSLRPESFGLLAVEAMAASMAVLATDAGGLAEIVTPDCGWLLPSQNPSSWPEVLNVIDKEGASRRGRNGLTRFNQRYTHQRYRNALTQVLGELA